MNWILTSGRASELFPRPSSPALLAEGIAHYRVNCLTCHGAPGVEPFELGKGLYPPAPDLSEPRVQARTDGQLFWIIRHGIRMTGMPAFESTHGEGEVWSLVAFLRHLPWITAEERELLETAHEAQQHRHESSGTAWQPDRASHEGVHGMRGDWMFLIQGFATAVYDNQGGMRGDEDFFGTCFVLDPERESISGPPTNGPRRSPVACLVSRYGLSTATPAVETQKITRRR